VNRNARDLHTLRFPVLVYTRFLRTRWGKEEILTFLTGGYLCGRVAGVPRNDRCGDAGHPDQRQSRHAVGNTQRAEADDRQTQPRILPPPERTPAIGAEKVEYPSLPESTLLSREASCCPHVPQASLPALFRSFRKTKEQARMPAVRTESRD